MPKKPSNPYRGMPDHCFWSRAHRVAAPELVDPVVKGGFRLTQKMKIATAGSCFAQHIARHLQGQGYNYLITEQAHPVIEHDVAAAFNYGTFTARYGNIYTTRQLFQLAMRAYGEFSPQEDVWQAPDGSLIDPFRPAIQPGGFASRAAFDADRETHFAAVRRMIEEADVFVFTFGLTETWISRKDGAAFALAPGVAGGTFDPKRHKFINLSLAEIVADFTAFVRLMRKRNRKVKILMTVSPVPLIATARTDQSVIAATAYSKAVLRVAAEELATTLDNAWYFPSYEVITGNAAQGRYFADDLREVTPAGIEHVMGLFMHHYTGIKTGSAKARITDDRGFRDGIEKALDVVCDEELIERVLK